MGLGVGFNGTRLVAVGIGQSSIQTSVDGLNWAGANAEGIEVGGYNVAYGNGKWVAVGWTNGDSTSTIQTSTDGLNWTSVSSNSFSIGFGVAYNSNTNLWVTAGVPSGDSTSTIQWSSDGVNWTSAQSGFDGAGYGVATSGPLWVATGASPTPLNTILWSSDGSNWNPALTGGFDYFGGPADAYGVAYSPQQNLWVAIGNSSNDSRSTIQWSSDGSNWNPAQTGGFDVGGTLGGGIAYSAGQNLWVAAGYSASGATLLSSADGSNWSPALSGGFQPMYLAGGVGVLAPNTTVDQGALISQSSIAVRSFYASTVLASTVNGVPYGRGYTDSVSFQYNYTDFSGFHAGTSLTNPSTSIGYVVNRPYAPINYYNIVYNGATAETYSLQLSSSVASATYTFSPATPGTPEFTEMYISSISTATSQLVSLSLDPGASGLTLYSVTLGFN